jgi:hypothetical protein
MLYLSVVWTVIGLAAIVRSYILLMGENTPDARRKMATTTRSGGFTPDRGRSNSDAGLGFHSLKSVRFLAREVCCCLGPEQEQSRLGKFGQRDKWSFCLTAARMAAEQEKR